MRNNPRVQALPILSALAVALLCGCGGRVDEAVFADKLSDYVSAPVSGTPVRDPIIHPRVLVVEPRTGAIDADVFGGLPDDLRATAPGDVGTVVRTHWRNRRIGYWTLSGDEQYRYHCTVTVIDWSGRKVVGRREFRGDDRAPDSEESTFTHRFASDLTEEVDEYLASLPRA